MFQDQGLPVDVGCTYDRITAGGKQLGLTEGFMPQVGLLLEDTKVIGDLLRSRQTCNDLSVTGNDLC